MQVLRQDGVLYRAEQGGLQAKQEQGKEQNAQVMQPESRTGDYRDCDFEYFGQPRQSGLVELVRQLPGGCRKEKERQDEDASGKVGQEPRLQGRPLRRLEREQNDERIFVEIVVESPEELCAEERAESA